MTFAVLSSGGLAGLGEKLFMVPWYVLQQPISTETIRLSMTAEQLKGTPSFEEEKWPDMEDRHWTDAVHVYYGSYGKVPAVGKQLPPKTAEGERGGYVPQRFLRANSVLPGTIANPQGQRLGDIKDIVMDTAAGKLTYVVLGFGGILGLGEKLIAVPWPELRASAGLGTFTLDVDKDTLQKAPGFDKDHWPQTAEPLKR
jgi:sporulation protein YlmC with PRC-barrel domain